jgi:hypothetical protein
MKPIIVLICIGLLLLLGCSKQKQSIEDIDFNKYLNKEVSCLLDGIVEQYANALPIEEPTAYLVGFMFYYPQKNIELFIYADSLQYQDRYNEQLQWDVEKFKKEKIHAIKLYGRDPWRYKKFISKQ